MDSGRFLLAVILMIAVMVITNLLFPPPAQTPAPAAVDTAGAPAGDGEASDTGAPPGAAGADDPEDVLRSGPEPAAPRAQPRAGEGAESSVDAAADTLVVRSELYEYAVSTRGAAIIGARLLQFAAQSPEREGRPVELAPGDEGLFAYRIRIGTDEVSLSDFVFRPEGLDSAVHALAAGTAGALRLTGSVDAGLGVSVVYEFDPDRYVVNVRMAVSGTGENTPTLLLRLPPALAVNEAAREEDERALGYAFNSEHEGIGTVRLSSVKGERVENGPLHWVAIKNKYFVAAALTDPASTSRFGGIIARPLPEKHEADLTATLLPQADGTFSFRLFLGPQEPARLAEMGNGFGDVNPFGWKPFRPILRPLGHGIQWAVFRLHDLLGIGYGWVLILFGVIIRILLWPLNAKAMRSQLKNMEIQPKLKEIQTKYKKDPERLQKEMLRLYREEGFNPMGGCLPMLVPLPILITLFFVFQSTIAFRGVEFLWLPDLSRADPFYILPVLLGVSMFLMQWLSSRSMTDQNPQMKFMMYAMPVVMTVIFLNFASGLNLYYASMNFASLPQQFQIMRERKRFQAARA